MAAPMAAPSSTSSRKGVLQVTNGYSLVAYHFWILFINNLDTSRNVYRQKGFDIETTPTACASWEIRYILSRSIDHLTQKTMSTMTVTAKPETLETPETPYVMPYRAAILVPLDAMGNTALILFVSPAPQALLLLQTWSSPRHPLFLYSISFE